MTLDLGIAPLKAEELKKDEVRNLAAEWRHRVQGLGQEMPRANSNGKPFEVSSLIQLLLFQINMCIHL